MKMKYEDVLRRCKSIFAFRLQTDEETKKATETAEKSAEPKKEEGNYRIFRFHRHSRSTLV